MRRPLLFVRLHAGPSIAPRVRSPAALIIATSALVACGGTSAPPPAAAPTPVPVVAPAPVIAPVRVAIASNVAARRYLVRASARVERDSAGRTDEQRVASEGRVTLSLQRASDGALRGSGRVEAFVTRIDGAGSATASAVSPAAPLSPVLFDAVLDAMSVRIVTRPPLVNECDRPEAGATSLVRDLLLRIPASVSVGDTWRDSTVSVMCRVGIPIIVRSVHEYQVERIDGANAAAVVVVRRATSSRLEGKSVTGFRAFEMTGIGSSTEVARVEAISGALLQLDGDGTLTLQLIDRGRPAAHSQRVTQHLATHALLTAP